MMAAPPSVNRRMIEALLGGLLPDRRGARLALVHGRFDGVDPKFALRTTAGKRQVRIRQVASVLGVVDAWREHEQDPDRAEDLLVITTPLTTDDLGWDVRAHTVAGRVVDIDRGEIVRQRFGAIGLDPRVRGEGWLLDALIDAEPVGGWPGVGGVLTRDAAVAALIGARLSTRTVREGALDLPALLAWTRTPGAAGYVDLPEAERSGIAGWLGETVDGAAPAVLALAAAGRAEDVLPLGLLGAVATRPGVSSNVIIDVGGLFAGIVKSTDVELLGKAVEATLRRWATEPANRDVVLAVATRADAIAATKPALPEALVDSDFLLSSFQFRLRALAASLVAPRRAKSAERMEASLVRVREHALAQLLPHRVRVADAAARLYRWLGEAPAQVTSVAEGVRDQMAQWGWVDRACTLLWAGDPTPDPVVADAYRRVHQSARDRREAIDEAFADRLRVWTVGASAAAPAGCLLIEEVMHQVVQPLADAKPLLVVLDGMSAAVAVELGAELNRAGWIEAAPQGQGRLAAVATVPSVTNGSRASLLSGEPTTGRQAFERTQFESFWVARRRTARLLHSADLAGAGGHRLSTDAVAALAEVDVLGVVLNTIDDALDHGREGDRAGWRVGDVTYLTELLDSARMYGRPVVLVSDHGHVLDRSTPGDGPRRAEGTESARWRTGTAADGEVELAGPRVLYGDGRVVVPWREDIRYVNRHAGYHGGAALAEMTVPVLVLLPGLDLLPAGWRVLSVDAVTPRWWNAEQVIASAPAVRKPSRRREQPTNDAVPLFEDVAEAAGSVGVRVVATDGYRGQRAFVRKPPENKVVADIIDALLSSGGTTPLVALAEFDSRARRNPEGYVATLQRLLNVEGYPVLNVIDGGRTVQLDKALLVEQFALKMP
ncbi:BREX-2 system phosphatase PglZ [Actinokineospora sp. NBRC 105648]|uniref:BREX-2 system phosphatase PglZ n=1 Tax=Actinokineospora sp. NBRC 105648 TaxID=3032206 RepID=UPI0024A4C31F|nr:BREX-2 system phosphatase PglZ [Actinokineospora sp. NBRC 105648]GLZ41160.1 hypothetical protein Acsp05_47840 [Actinokineospora sp. NBRC 105648]